METKKAHFEPEQFEDRYEEALKDLLKKKQSGQKIEAPKEREPSKVVNLMDALRRSVEQNVQVENFENPPRGRAIIVLRRRPGVRVPVPRRLASWIGLLTGWLTTRRHRQCWRKDDGGEP